MTPRFPSRPGLYFVCALILLAGPGRDAMAAWPHPINGGVPVTTDPGSQGVAVSVSDGAGGTILAWVDLRATIDVYAQRVDSYGHTKWAGAVPVCTATGTQDQITMVPDGAGGAWIAWRDARSGNQDIYAARISSAGVVTPPNGMAICTAVGNQTIPKVVSTFPGDAIVVWQDARAGNQDIYIQRFNVLGTVWTPADGKPVAVVTGDQINPVIATNVTNGSSCVTWADFRGGFFQVYAQLINGSGNPSWAVNGVRSSSVSTIEFYPSVVLIGGSDYIVSWSDFRSATNQIYAQRLEGTAGARQWGTDGVALAPAAGAQQLLSLVPDGLGGAIAVWQDARSAALAIYAQHVTAQGVPNWTSDGVPIVTGWGFSYSAIAPDLQGGVLVSWADSRFGNSDLFAQRLSGAGVEYWNSNGRWVANSNSPQLEVTAVSDIDGGGIFTWDETPFGTPDIFAKRVDRWGILGAEPEIVSIADVRNDQGGRVKVSWNASPLETDPSYEFVVGHYEVFRSVPTFAAMERLRAGAQLIGEGEPAPAGRPALMRLEQAGVSSYWEEVGVQSAFQLPSYSLVVPTTGDSVGGSNPYTQFMVQARAGAGDKWWASAPDSAYSVDNLAPGAPAAFTGIYSSGSSQLNWDPNGESDLAGYRLYRGLTAGFVPGPSNLVAVLGQTDYLDNAGAPYFYKLSSIDVHGNESAFATVQPAGTTDAPPPGATAELMLAPVQPNPARVLAGMRYAIPREARVSLAVFDPSGRRVRSLFQGRATAGEHFEYWDGTDDSGARVASGRYFVRLETTGRVLSRSFALVK